jgi:hypothetical protein
MFRFLAALSFALAMATPAAATDTTLPGGRSFTTPGALAGCRPTSVMPQDDGKLVEITPCAMGSDGKPIFVFVTFEPISETATRAYLEASAAKLYDGPVTIESRTFKTRAQSGEFLCFAIPSTRRGSGAVAECALADPTVRIVVLVGAGDIPAADATMERAIAQMTLR